SPRRTLWTIASESWGSGSDRPEGAPRRADEKSRTPRSDENRTDPPRDHLDRDAPPRPSWGRALRRRGHHREEGPRTSTPRDGTTGGNGPIDGLRGPRDQPAAHQPLPARP